MDIEKRLSAVLCEFARTMVTDFPIQAILDHLVIRIADVLPVTAAGVTLISADSHPHYIAASDGSALIFERLQSELGEGPCLRAYRTGRAVAVPDLRDDDQFPNFSPQAMEAGLAAVFTLPLRHGDQQLGALDLYRTTPGPLDVAEMSAAQTLADVTAAYLLNARSRADLKASSECSRQSALHDALTGLPNRQLLIEHLDHAILRCRRSGKLVAIPFADLDAFKSINDTYGHHIGDELLIAVARRLTGILRPGDTLARFGGDEFVILCEELDEAEQIDAIADRVNAALAGPFVLSEHVVEVSASVGIAYTGRGDEVPGQLLVDADLAMYQVKRRGGARHAVFDLREQHLTDQRLHLSRDLQGAMSRGELHTNYQPIVDARGGQIVGVEALLRWRHPVDGLIGPDIAVPLAEKSGLITGIGRWVLEQACLDRQRWQPGGVADLELSVNVSPRQIMVPGYVDSVAAVLAATETDPTSVMLEVTESVFIQDDQGALVALAELKELGVRLALDDFGTGFSSLSYLKQFPFDQVKIDRAFIADLPTDAPSMLIVEAIIGLAQALHMTVVAEGVETTAQRDAVIELGCDLYQGFAFARPVSADDLDTLWQGSGWTPSELIAASD